MNLVLCNTQIDLSFALNENGIGLYDKLHVLWVWFKILLQV